MCLHLIWLEASQGSVLCNTAPIQVSGISLSLTDLRSTLRWCVLVSLTGCSLVIGQFNLIFFWFDIT